MSSNNIYSSFFFPQIFSSSFAPFLKLQYPFPKTKTINNKMSSSSNNHAIYSKENNPVRKIPIIHRILSFAASNVIDAEKKFSVVCADFREAVEVYGPAFFTGFAERDPREFFRFVYTVIDGRVDSDHANAPWLVANMIQGWNDNSYRILKSAKKNNKKKRFAVEISMAPRLLKQQSTKRATSSRIGS